MDVTGYLPTFLAVCDEGGFHKASQKLNLSQPAVSYQIRTLERLLGLPLFVRAGRGVVLTERGVMLRDYCRQSLREFETLRKELLSDAPSTGRTLKIASVSAFGRYVLFPLLRKRFRQARVELRFPTQDDVLRLVLSGFADVGFIYDARVSSELTLVNVATEELVLVTPRARTKSRRRLTFDAVTAMRFVTWDECEYVFGRWFDAIFGRQPGPLRSVAHFEEMEEVLEWIRCGAGVSIVPRDCADALLRKGLVALAPLPRGKRCSNEIFAVYRPDRQREDVDRLIAQCRDAFAAFSL